AQIDWLVTGAESQGRPYTLGATFYLNRISLTRGERMQNPMCTEPRNARIVVDGNEPVSRLQPACGGTQRIARRHAPSVTGARLGPSFHAGEAGESNGMTALDGQRRQRHHANANREPEERWPLTLTMTSRRIGHRVSGKQKSRTP